MAKACQGSILSFESLISYRPWRGYPWSKFGFFPQFFIPLEIQNRVFYNGSGDQFQYITVSDGKTVQSMVYDQNRCSSGSKCIFQNWFQRIFRFERLAFQSFPVGVKILFGSTKKFPRLLSSCFGAYRWIFFREKIMFWEAVNQIFKKFLAHKPDANLYFLNSEIGSR